jgi:two-component system sensor histidine kinase/response regulator
MHDQDPVDNRKALNWLEGDEQMFMKIKAIFIKNMPSQIMSLKDSLGGDDAASIERFAHSIRGSAAMMGAGVLSEEAGVIEMCAIAGDLNSARARFSTLFGAYERVMEALASEGGK